MSLMSCETSWYSKANQFPKSIYCSENVMVMAHLCQNHPSNKQEAQRQIEQMKVGDRLDDSRAPHHGALVS